MAKAKFGRDTYKKAIETGDGQLLADAFGQGVKFYVPVREKPYVGRMNAVKFLAQLGGLFQNFRWIDQMDGNDGSRMMLFQATIPATATTPEVEITAGDYMKSFNGNDRITEFYALARPRVALEALTAHGIKGPDEL